MKDRNKRIEDKKKKNYFRLVLVNIKLNFLINKFQLKFLLLIFTINFYLF